MHSNTDAMGLIRPTDVQVQCFGMIYIHTLRKFIANRDGEKQNNKHSLPLKLGDTDIRRWTMSFDQGPLLLIWINFNPSIDQ